MNIETLLTTAVQRGASDLHLSAGLPPLLRIQGALTKLDSAALDAAGAMELLHQILSPEQQAEFATRRELDCAYSIPNLGRFRLNCFQQQRGISAVFRIIPAVVPTLASLALPTLFHTFADYRQGLVLITGATGSGKSTSLAAIINHINVTQHKHIITLEDPIEFIHNCEKSLISQRGIGSDTANYHCALRAALREDPDVIVVGELRDQETIRLALTAAETGHLVFATLHSHGAPKTIDRIIDVFPSGEKPFIATLLAECLSAVVAQQWLMTEHKRQLVLEILIATAAIRNLIREHKSNQIYSVMQTGQAQGMCTFEQYARTSF